MSAAEIISVVKAINDHVTNKYSDAIIGYLNEKTNAHIMFEREFFDAMDQSAQILVNNITTSLKPTSLASGYCPNNMLNDIQKHCNKYNAKKKLMYDNHLTKIKEFEQKFIQIIQQTLKEKVIQQNKLFDAATTPAATEHQHINEDIINLLNIVQNSRNVQHTQNNATNQVDQAVNDNEYGSNATNVQNVQNGFTKINNSQPLYIKPTQTPSALKQNNIDQVNQLISLLSQVGEINGNDNISNDNNINSIISVPNGNPFTHSHDNNNNNSMRNNNNNNTNPRFLNPFKTQNGNKGNGATHLQLQNLIAPIHYGNTKAPLPIQPQKVPTLTTTTTTAPTNILPSFPNNNLNNTTTSSNASNMQNSGTNIATNSLSPTAPPKPPPPPKTRVYYESSTDSSDSDHKYECTLCNTYYNTAKEWKYHLKKSHLKTHQRKRKLHSKQTRKRVFSETHDESDNTNIGQISNKRTRQIFSCELCNQQFSRLTSYAKHYNHHMNTNANNMCNFCLNQFKNQNQLQRHINIFGAGISIEDGHYQCCQCTMKFTHENKLQSHINDAHMNKNKVKSLKMLQLFSTWDKKD